MSTFTSEPGTRLGGRYRLEDRLAAASGWSAWKAIDEILARPVSVITFVAGFPRLEQVVTAARAASRLTDTRLTQVFDVEDDWEHAYIVLEWPFGETLADLLSAGPMDPLAGARIVAEVAAALSGAHAAGLAHLCLRPDTVRWTAGGGVKVTGLGIDAALTGVSSEDPELADTRGLGELLYAALTGLWPGPDSPELPPAPESDGWPRRPRQVRAGVPTVLDDVVCRALALPGRDGHAPIESPAELAAALAAAIPPVQVPPALQRDPRHDPRREPGRSGQPSTQPAAVGGYPQGRPAKRRSAGRVAAVSLLVLVAIVGASAAAMHLLSKSPSASSPAGKSSPKASNSSSQLAVIKPISASGFDPLSPGDAGDENSNQAPNVLTGNPAGWSTQQYLGSPYFGHLKAGTGLILNLGHPVRVSSVTVTFGSVPGADVEIKLSDSGARSQANLSSMTTVAADNDVSGTETFTVRQQVTDQYLVIWFTKLPPMAKADNKYMAQVFSVLIHGHS
jgi:serine/threonine protein kinase